MRCHFLSDRLGGICSYFLLATSPQFHPSLPSSALATCPTVKLYYLLRVLGVRGWGGGWKLWTPNRHQTKAVATFKSWQMGQNHWMDPDLRRGQAEAHHFPFRWTTSGLLEEGHRLGGGGTDGKRALKCFWILIQTVIFPHTFSWLSTRKESESRHSPNFIGPLVSE